MKFILFIATVFMLFSCKNGNTYTKQVKELDSLKVVLQEAISNFNTIDSVKCYQNYSEQYTYFNFIRENLKDTISKTEAENLQMFVSLGKNMLNYLAKKPNWTQEANISLKQLTDLSYDLKNGNIENEEAVDFILKEKTQAFKIIDELKTNTELMRYSLETFTNTLPTVENIVKKLNNGNLPELDQPKIRLKPKKH